MEMPPTFDLSPEELDLWCDLDGTLNAEFLTLIHSLHGPNKGARITMQVSGHADDELGQTVFYGTLALGNPDSWVQDANVVIRQATEKEIATFRARRLRHLTETVDRFCQSCESAPCECLD